MSPNTKFKKLISLLFIFNISVWIVLGSKLENPDWKMWIDTDDGQLNNKRITAKSVFVAPLISKCSDGYKLDHLGRCIKIASINHSNQWQFLLDKLNSMFASPKPESNFDSLGSEPFKLNIPINNNVDNVKPDIEINQNKTKYETTINNGDFQEISSTTEKHDITTRKIQDFTNSQTDFTNKNNDFSTKFETSKYDWKESTKPFQESTITTNENKYETYMWITEKPKKNVTQSKPVETIMTTSDLPTTNNIEFNKLTTNSENLTTLFVSTEIPDDKQTTNQMLQTNSEPYSDIMENTNPSSPFDKLTTVPLMEENFNKNIVNVSKSELHNQYVTTTDAPFLIIVTDTNNSHTNDTDYILISNSSNNVNNKQNLSQDSVNKINEEQVVNKINKIVDKMCIDTELCNDEIVLPYFESTKTIRNSVNSHSKNETQLESMNKYIKPILENSKIIQILQNNNKLTNNTRDQSIVSNIGKLNKTESIRLDSSQNAVYESLKMPIKTTNVKTESSTVQSHTTNHQLLHHIMQPTSKLYVSTPVYNPKKMTTTSTTTKTPVLTTTKRIQTHLPLIRPNVDSHFSMKPNDLVYSLQPNNNEFSFQTIVTDDANYNSQPDPQSSNDYFYASNSNQNQLTGNRPSNTNADFNNYDSTSSFIRFPNDQPYSQQYSNSKFSIDFQNTFGAQDAQQGSSNSYIRFPTISRTPASTYNSDNSNRWSNTRWPPVQQQQQQPLHQSGQYENSWNSRWPPSPPQHQQQYYNQNSRYQQNIPIKNYKLLQI